MTNYEKNKEQLDMYTIACARWSVNRDGEISECTSCANCIFNEKGSCTQKRLEWLQQEYEAVDWTKVEVDTPILVRDNESDRWHERHFAVYFFGKVFAFNAGNTSKNYSNLVCWNYAKLRERDD